MKRGPKLPVFRRFHSQFAERLRVMEETMIEPEVRQAFLQWYDELLKLAGRDVALVLVVET